MNASNNLSARLAAWRATAGLSQRAAAQRAGVPYESWRNWEERRRTPSAATVRYLETILAAPGGVANENNNRKRAI